jgi:hypothetical protein
VAAVEDGGRVVGAKCFRTGIGNIAAAQQRGSFSDARLDIGMDLRSEEGG